MKKSAAQKNVGIGARFANAVFGVASSLTLGGAQRLGRVCGALMHRLPGSYKQRAALNLSLALPKASNELLRSSLEHVASLFLEMPYWHSSRHSARHIKAQSDGYDWSEIDALLAQGKGLILISPHVGNFELLGPVFAQRHRSTVMFRVPKMRWLRQWIEVLRSRAQQLCNGIRSRVENESVGRLVLFVLFALFALFALFVGGCRHPISILTSRSVTARTVSLVMVNASGHTGTGRPDF